MNVIWNFWRKHFPHKTIINVAKYDFWHIYDSFIGKMFPQEVSYHIHKCVWKLSFLIEMTVLWTWKEQFSNTFMKRDTFRRGSWILCDSLVTYLWKWQIYDNYVIDLWQLFDSSMQMPVLWQIYDVKYNTWNLWPRSYHTAKKPSTF